MLKGTGVSSGIGMAPVVLLVKQEIVIPDGPAADPTAEAEAFRKAHSRVIDETDQLMEKANVSMGAEEAAIFEAHKMILEDPELTAPIYAAIEGGENAAAAIEGAMISVIEIFEAMDDDYMRERAADMRDIKDRLLRAVLGIEEKDISSLPESSIIAAHDLTPSDTARMDKAHVAGILTEIGGRTSHSAIMARSMEVPAVVGCADVLSQLKEGMLIAIDGDAGTVELEPNVARQAELRALQAAQAEEKEALHLYRDRPTVTSDGRHVEAAANIGTPEEALRAFELGAETIGLFRSEFLYMDRQGLPTEEEQFEAYRQAVCAMEGRPVIVRTLDIGGDKKLPALPLPAEENPFLGYRAIRLCLDQKNLFLTQLRALLRASAFGKLRIMFPMISSLEELRRAKAILEEAKAALRAENTAFDEAVEVGIMIEIPAAALLADAFAKECDFFSIGTNDLIQYTVAVDRGNERIASLYSQYHPAVLRLIDMTITAAHRNGIFCGMCGEAAGDPKLIPVLLGMGLDEFSMSAGSILSARRQICEADSAVCAALAQEVLSLSTAEEVKARLEQFGN